MRHSGPMWVYFNRKVEAPRVWCVSSPDRTWEICVVSVEIETPSRTYYRPEGADPDHTPAAWLVTTGNLEVHDDGTATISQLEGYELSST